MADKQFRLTPFASALALALSAMPPAALAQLVVSEDMTGTSTSYDWLAIGGACLTARKAGDGSASTIPGCLGLSDYSGRVQVGGDTGQLLDGIPDPPGKGALRLTNGDTVRNGGNGNMQKGAVYSKFEFPSNQGVDITFKTVTYGGNGFKNEKGQQSGADGMSFFLVDAAQVRDIKGLPPLGYSGGALAYICYNGIRAAAQDDPGGMLGAYLGLGIDEYGNFHRRGDYGDEDYIKAVPNSIILRGAGSIRWETLKKLPPNSFTGQLTNEQKMVVQRACRKGVHEGEQFKNYPILTSVELGTGVTLFNQQAVPRPQRDKATPFSYNLKITQDGLLSFSYSVDNGSITNVIRDRDITKANGPLPAKLRFGFAAATGGGSNVHEIMCFRAEPASNSVSSAEGNIPPDGRVQVGSQLYLASYHPRNWWGQLRAHRLVLNADDSASIAPRATWDASCVLTGGACAATGGGSAAAQASRRLLTWDGAQGVELNYDNLGTVQKQSLPADAAAFIDYLRGDRSREIQPGGQPGDPRKFRRRDGLLGDIMHSSPTWVGAPGSPYAENWADRLYPGKAAPEGTSYRQFAAAQAGRTHVVYAGANDGFLHGFRSGRLLSNGSFDTLRNDGREVLGYMPGQALRTMAHPSEKRLNYGDTQYSHNAYVDATPGVGDLFVKEAWRTWLAGGLGAGGNVNASGVPQGVIADDTSIGTGALYLLDVTNPDQFGTAAAHDLVLGEWNSRTLRCAGDTAANRCGDSLGNVYGRPLIRRLHNGGWGIIFPNGQNSESGKSGIFVLLIDPKGAGVGTFRFLPAGQPERNASGQITRRNGITQVTAADLDGDHITDYVYAGDMLGNVWRFDLTSEDPANWAVRSTPVFNAGRPITTSVLVSTTAKNDIYRIVLNFGTGKIYPQTLNAGEHFAPGPYALYGIWDADMQAWNARSSTAYESLAPGDAAPVAERLLQVQTLAQQAFDNAALGISGVRTVTQHPVCWKNGKACASGNDRMGWRMVLPDAGEQIVYNPAFMDGMLVVNTTTPAVNRALSCEVKQATGYTLALRPDTGTVRDRNYFMNTGYTGPVIAGIGTSGTGAALPVETDSRKFIVTQTEDGSGKVFEVDPGVNVNAQRVNWWRVR